MKSNIKKWAKENKSHITIFLIYEVISFCLIFFHEAWRDEAQSWLLVRELNLVELIFQMKYEGHFLLWYLILMPFAKLGFPYIATNIISWIITSISVWLIIKYAPFRKYKKYLFIFSFPMLYLFPIISRCYCLIPLAITLIAIFYKDRKEKSIRYLFAIALLANTHIIMLGMVGILLLEFYIEQLKNRKLNSRKENKNIILSFIIIGIILIFSVLPLIECATTRDYISSREDIKQKLCKMLFEEPYIMLLHIYYAFCSNENILIIIGALVTIFVFEETVNNKKDCIKIFLILLSQYIIYSFIYSSSYQRGATGILIIFFYRWIRVYAPKKEIKKIDRKITEVTLLGLLMINIIGGIIYIKDEIKYNYSTAYQVGTYINKNVDEESIIVTGSPLYYGTSVIPYVSESIKFYYIPGDKYFTYTSWNENNEGNLDENFIVQLENEFDKDKNLYYLYAYEESLNENNQAIINEMVEKHVFKKLFESEKDFYAGESYILYEININNYEIKEH